MKPDITSQNIAAEGKLPLARLCLYAVLAALFAAITGALLDIFVIALSMYSSFDPTGVMRGIGLIGVVSAGYALPALIVFSLVIGVPIFHFLNLGVRKHRYLISLVISSVSAVLAALILNELIFTHFGLLMLFAFALPYGIVTALLLTWMSSAYYRRHRGPMPNAD